MQVCFHLILTATLDVMVFFKGNDLDEVWKRRFLANET